MEEVKNDEGKIIGYIETIDKMDYVYDLDKNLIGSVYNNDYKLIKLSNKLSKIEKIKNLKEGI